MKLIIIKVLKLGQVWVRFLKDNQWVPSDSTKFHWESAEFELTKPLGLNKVLLWLGRVRVWVGCRSSPIIKGLLCKVYGSKSKFAQLGQLNLRGTELSPKYDFLNLGNDRLKCMLILLTYNGKQYTTKHTSLWSQLVRKKRIQEEYRTKEDGEENWNNYLQK